MDLAHTSPVVDETDLYPICRSMVRVHRLSKTRDLIRACPLNEWPIIGLSAVFILENPSQGLDIIHRSIGRRRTLGAVTMLTPGQIVVRSRREEKDHPVMPVLDSLRALSAIRR